MGVTRYLGQRPPQWMDEFPYLFAFFGIAVGTYLVRLVLAWLPLLLQPTQYKRWNS